MTIAENTEVLGIDLGGTQIKAVLVDRRGRILRKELRPTFPEEEDPQSWAGTIRSLADAMAPGLPVGLSAPGLAAPDRRSIAFMPGRLQGLEGLDWGKFLERHFVPVTNDAHASLLGEAWLGAASGFRDIIMLTLGTGVGGAVMVDGKLLRGHLGRAGHLGHVCLERHGTPDIVGIPGSLEDFIGNHNVRERTGGRFSTTHDLIASFRTGDPQAAEFWLASIHALACALASFINIFDPEAIILGGGIGQAGDALFAPLAKALDPMEWRPGGHRVKLLSASLGEWAGAIGAAREAANAAEPDATALSSDSLQTAI